MTKLKKIIAIAVFTFIIGIGVYAYIQIQLHATTFSIKEVYSAVKIESSNSSRYVFYHGDFVIQDIINSMSKDFSPYDGKSARDEWDFRITFGTHYAIGENEAYFLPDERPSIVVQLWKDTLSIDGELYQVKSQEEYQELYNAVKGFYTAKIASNSDCYEGSSTK